MVMSHHPAKLHIDGGPLSAECSFWRTPDPTVPSWMDCPGRGFNQGLSHSTQMLCKCYQRGIFIGMASAYTGGSVSPCYPTLTQAQKSGAKALNVTEVDSSPVLITAISCSSLQSMVQLRSTAICENQASAVESVYFAY